MFNISLKLDITITEDDENSLDLNSQFENKKELNDLINEIEKYVSDNPVENLFLDLDDIGKNKHKVSESLTDSQIEENLENYASKQDQYNSDKIMIEKVFKLNPDPLEDQIANLNKFAIKLYSESNKNVNTLLSPLCISTGLLALLHGSNNKTKSQFLNLLEMDSIKLNDIISSYKKFSNYLKSLQNENSTFEFNNILIFSKEIVPKETYLSDINEFFNTSCVMLDLKSSDSMLSLDKQISQLTNKSLNKFDLFEFNFDQISLVSLMSFDSLWHIQFDKNLTKKELFYLNSNESLEIDQMRSLNTFNVQLNPCGLPIRICHLHFVNKTFVMTFILPDIGFNLENIEKELSYEKLQEIFNLKNSSKRKCKLQLPKFKLKLNEQLKNDLKSSGLIDAFDGNLADFSKISESSSVLFVSNVIHYSLIELGESGISHNGLDCSNVNYTELFNLEDEHDITEFIFNRPFIFALHESKYNSILLIGKIINPYSNSI